MPYFPTPSARRGLAAGFWWLLPLLAGTVARLLNLPAQILGDDELHAVRSALAHPVRQILVTYEPADNCIPLSAFFRLLLDSGLRLSEPLLRAPGLAAGILLLALLPWAIGPALAPSFPRAKTVALTFAWLLALSPPLVLYSGIVRSYMPEVLLGAGAAVAFLLWWRRPRLLTGALYALLAALAVWFHLGAGPFVASPLLWGAGALLLDRRPDPRRRARLWGLPALAGALALGLLAFLLPARASFLELVEEKHQPVALPAAAIRGALLLQAGNAHLLVALLFWGTALAGLLLLFRRDRPLALYTLVLVLGNLVGLLLLAPEGIELPLVFNRYLLIALPAVLLWVAVALGSAAPPAAPAAAPAAAVAFLLLLTLTGPLADSGFRHSPFAHNDLYMEYCTPRGRLAAADVPELYRGLPGATPILEYPWMPLWRLNRALGAYQEWHGQELVVASQRPALWDERLAFRNMVPGDPESFLASRARYLVVHRDLAREEIRVPHTAQRVHDDLAERLQGELAGEAKAMARRLKREWGPPDYADEWVQAWDLAAVRGRLAAER